MLTFKEAWECEVEQQRKDYYDRVGDHPSSSPPLLFNTRPPTIPVPVMTQAWPELSGMSAIFARENYQRSVKAQNSLYTGKTHKRLYDDVYSTAQVQAREDHMSSSRGQLLAHAIHNLDILR